MCSMRFQQLYSYYYELFVIYELHLSHPAKNASKCIRKHVLDYYFYYS